MGAMQESVKDRIGNRRVCDPAMPMLCRQLGGNHRGVTLGAVINNFHEVFTAGGIERVQTPVIEHQHIEAGEHGQTSFMRAITACDMELLEQSRERAHRRRIYRVGKRAARAHTRGRSCRRRSAR